MTILYIYRESDINDTKVLYALHNGHHFIGRESSLAVCDDKRISRKHACINVHKNGATLESVHVNPTFFKSPVGDTIQILNENESLELNNGDRFALLEDTFWFKVKIMYENNEEKVPDEQPHININNKRSRGSDMPTVVKKERIDSPAISDDSLTDTEENVLDTNEYANNGEPLAYLNSTETNPLDTTMELANRDQNLSNGNIETEPPEIEPPMPLPKPLIKSEPDVENTLRNNNIETEPDPMPLPMPAIKLEPSPDEQPMPLPIPVIKPEPVDEASYIPCGSTSNGTISGRNSIKTEPVGDPDQPSSSTNNTEPSWKREHPEWRRDRCWYGKDCYRKNPAHKEDFSHPNDNDYDSDPSDIRPFCPFGISCYRINIQHRREYKHVGKPAKKPNNTNNVNIRVQVNGCGGCDRHQHHKPGYESEQGYESEDTDPE